MSATRLFIDLETYRTRDEAVMELLAKDQIHAAPPKKPNRKWSAEAIEAWHSKESQNQRAAAAVAHTSCDPLFAEILCIAVAVDDEEADVLSCMPDGEADGLAIFSEWVDGLGGTQTTWVGHGLINFDLGVLLSRYRKFRIEPPKQFPVFLGRHWMGRVYDTMMRTPCKSGLNLVSLEDACTAYGIPSSKAKYCLEDGTPIHGGTVGLAFDTGAHEMILAYGKEDIVATRELYRAQTFGYSRDCWEADDRNLEEITKLRDSDIPIDQRCRLVLEALAATGRVSRDLLPREV